MRKWISKHIRELNEIGEAAAQVVGTRRDPERSCGYDKFVNGMERKQTMDYRVR